jgi:hypothetical protein
LSSRYRRLDSFTVTEAPPAFAYLPSAVVQLTAEAGHHNFCFSQISSQTTTPSLAHSGVSLSLAVSLHSESGDLDRNGVRRQWKWRLHKICSCSSFFLCFLLLLLLFFELKNCYIGRFLFFVLKCQKYHFVLYLCLLFCVLMIFLYPTTFVCRTSFVL